MTNPAARVASHPTPPAAPLRPKPHAASKSAEFHVFASLLGGHRARGKSGALAGKGKPAAPGARPALTAAEAAPAGRPPLVAHGPHHRHDQPKGDDGHDAPAPLDPLARHLALDRPLPVPPPAAAPPPNAPLIHVEQLVARLVRRVAWGGDGRRGAARIEVGAGELAGATITVESCGRELSLDVDLPPGVPADAWRERIAARLRSRGFELASIDVH